MPPILYYWRCRDCPAHSKQTTARLTTETKASKHAIKAGHRVNIWRNVDGRIVWHRSVCGGRAHKYDVEEGPPY